MQISPSRVSAQSSPTKPIESAWRGRTLTVCILVALLLLGVAASNLDWSQDLAMNLGELAGMIAPLALLSLIAWGITAMVSRKP